MSKMKPLTYGSLFSGTECMSAAAIGLPLVPKFFAEVEPYPCAILRSKFPNVPNLGDVTGIKYNQAERTLSNGRQTVDLADGLDILCGGSPCFVAGTLVLTPLGYRPIESLKVGDEVVGGITGEIRRVEAVGSKMAKVGNLKILGRPEITCTPNHPFYCIDVKRDDCSKSPTFAKLIPVGDYEKVHAEDAVGKYAGRVKQHEILTNHATPKVGNLTHAEVMNLAGWYVGDGSIHKWRGKSKKTVMLSLYAKEKIAKFRALYEGKVHFYTTADGKIEVCNTAFADWLIANFGEHATDKFVSYWVYSDAARQDFIDGYLATDGCMIGTTRKFTSVSPRLAYGIADLVGNAAVSVRHLPPKGFIKGREVNQHDTYVVQCPERNTKTKLINGRYASIIRNYDNDGRTTARVFNITVSDEHAYIAEGICVGNCQDMSVAGKRAGADGDKCDDVGTTRSSLIFTYIRLLREIKPRYFIYENVPGLLTSNEGRDFAHFLVALGECGYEDVAWRVLDAQYVRVDGMERAVPQRRRRVWVVGRLGADYGGAAEILLEPHRDPGHLPPRRKTREEVAAGAGRWLELHGGMVGEAGRDLFGRVGGDGRGGVGAFNFEPWANPPRNLIDALCARRAGDWMVADKTRAVSCQHSQISMNCGEEFPPPIMARDYKDPTIVATAPVASFDPAEPGGLKTVRQDNAALTLVNGTCPGQHGAIIQRVTNSNGGDVAPTLTASIRSHTEQQMERGGGYVIEHVTNSNGENVAPCLTTELAHQTGNHQLHSGGYVIEKTTKSNGGDVAPSLTACDLQKQTSNEADKGGDGERLAQSNVAGTRNVFDGERAQEVVVEKPKSTCLTPGDPITKRVYTADDLPRVIVRRLTPTECERLMGLPQQKYIRISDMNNDEFVAWEIAKGNISVDIENGIVYSNRRAQGIPCEPHELKGTMIRGYRHLKIVDGKVRRAVRHHRVVWIAAHGIPPEGMVVDHINNNKSDNRICNLQLLTPEDNSRKAYEDGLYLTGADNPATKLSECQVEEVLMTYQNGATLRETARMFGISKSRVHQLVHEYGWTQVRFTPDQIADDALVEDFRRIHDAFAQMVAKPGTTPKPKTAKFVRDWLTRISDPATCPDAPRYKACGNGWAANQPRWILFNLLALDNPDWQEEWFAPRPQSATAYGINAQASLMHPCTREVSQTLTVCHQGGGSTANQNNIKMI